APSALQRRLDWVSRTLKLDQREAACLAALCRLTQLQPFRSFGAAISNFHEERDEISADFIGELVKIRGGSLRKVFFRHGNLMRLGLIEDRGGRDYAPSEILLRILRQRTTDERALEDVLIGETFTS